MDAAFGRHLLENGGVVGTGTGKINSARSFPGTAGLKLWRNQSLSEFSLGSSHLSFSMWINQSGSSTGDKGLIGKFNSGSNREWLCYLANSDSKFHMVAALNDSTLTDIAWTSTVSTSTWYHVCGGWDGTNVWIVVNAGTRVTGARSGPIQATTVEKFEMGDESGGGAINGLIDECVIWIGRDITDPEVSTLYNSGNGLALTSY